MKRKLFEDNVPHKLLITARKKPKLSNAFSNELTSDTRLIKRQISKIIPLGLTAVASAADAGIHKKVLDLEWH